MSSEVLEKVEELVEEGDVASLRSFLAGLDPYLVKEILERVSPELRVKIIPHIPPT